MKIFLITLLCIGTGVVGFLTGAALTGKRIMPRLDYERFQVQKYQHYMQTYDVWIMAKKYGKPLDEYLLKRGIRRVVIYGTTLFGVRLYHELKDTEVEVLYALDRNPKFMFPGLKVYTWGDLKNAPAAEEKQKVDAVLVAVFLSYESVKPELENAGYRHVLAFDEVLYNLLET